MMQKNQAQVKELAEQVKNFFYEKSEICKNLFSQNNSYESLIIALSALDGLSAIWNILSSTNKKSNKQRYVNFLIEIDNNNTQKLSKQKLSKICTPFLIHCLKKQNLEADFSTKLENKYLFYCQDSNGDSGNYGNPRKRQSHTPSDDPTIEETRNIYNSCNTNNSDQPRIKSIDETLLDFTYGGLIYKIYRCSFIHAFRRSQYNQVTFFEGNNITVKHYIEPPQLDVGIELLIDYIKKGADLVYGLVIEQSFDDIPDITDEIKIKTKQSSKKLSDTQQQEMILKDLQSLNSQQQQNVLEFINFLINKNQAEQSENRQNEEQDISFYEATKEIAGSLDWGPGDLATNKKYLEDMGK